MSERDELTFASAGVAGIHYARCWECMLIQCPGGWHQWADSEDIEHAAKTGQPDPSGKRCACDCVDGPTLEPEYDLTIDTTDLADAPCVLCGEAGACGYDSEGRPMIHATWMDDDEGEL